MKRRLARSIIWSGIFFTVLAAAAPSPTPAPSAVSEPQLHPLDSLQEHLVKKKKSRSARILKQASDALDEDNFAQARALAERVQRDPLFADYGFWIAAQALREIAKKAFEAKNFPEALRSAQRAVSLAHNIDERQPYSPLLKNVPREVASAELLMGEAYWAQGKWSQATDAYERAFQRLSTQGTLNQLLPQNLAHYGESCTKRASTLCPAWVQRFCNWFTRGSEEIKALSVFFPNAGERSHYHSVAKTTQAYKAPDLDNAAYDTAMKLYFDEKYTPAARALRQFQDDFPRSVHRYRARYWLAQALSHQQDHEKASKQFQELMKDSPLTYYGLMSAIANGLPVDQTIDTTVPNATDNDPNLLPSELYHLKRAEAFVAEHATDLANLEMRDLRPREALSSPFLLYLAMLANEGENYNAAFIILGDLIGRNYEGIFSSTVLRMIFPVVYREEIEKVAKEEQVDPVLVLSLIKQESAFDANAGSSVGAMGLMQLMPATAVETVHDVRVADLADAETNITVGTKYLKMLLNRYNGNIVYALAAYNAGPNALDRWVRDTPPKRGIQEFIESIPYRETRDYVSGIIRNYFWYARKLYGQTPKGLAYFWNTYGPPEAAPAKVTTSTTN
ncbi:MAG: transglycosylase SLT domain-containing protein [Bdellovibrionota bacterium]